MVWTIIAIFADGIWWRRIERIEKIEEIEEIEEIEKNEQRIITTNIKNKK
ncbi:hypothetical protein [Prevotella sp. P3-122]|nr:hypothetical protein [Prevotella sp. P3-122]